MILLGISVRLVSAEAGFDDFVGLWRMKKPTYRALRRYVGS
jgi:hypothetical protein